MHGAMFCPIIMGLDKTTVSVATGQNEYYPLYITIGNISNTLRRSQHNAIILLGFLSIPKSVYIEVSLPVSNTLIPSWCHVGQLIVSI